MNFSTLILTLTLSQNSTALTWQDLTELGGAFSGGRIDNPYIDEVELNRHEFGSNTNGIRARLTSEKASLNDIIGSAVSDSGFRAVSQDDFSGAGLRGRVGKGYHSVHSLEKNGIPICRYEIRSGETSSGSSFVMGRAPNINPGQVAPTIEDFPLPKDSMTFLKDYLAERYRRVAYDAIIPGLPKPCYWIDQGEIVPVWRTLVHVGRFAFEAFSSSAYVYFMQKQFFTVSASIDAYEFNPSQSEVKTFSVEVDSSGTLTNNYFETNPVDKQRVTSNDNKFQFSPDSNDFAEASVFAHANAHFDYMKGRGYKWEGEGPIELKIFGSSIDDNNAYYEPSESTISGKPRITIGKGDGSALQNLMLDRDVVSHEFGHHVVFRAIKSTFGESLVLHEGLADFFAFAGAKEACLGESICPDGSEYCVVPRQCLRSGETDLTYGSGAYNSVQEHLQSQVISGMLWDIASVGSMNVDTLASVVNKALDYMVSNSGLTDFILALMLADHDINDGVNSCILLDAANNRGMSSKTEGIDCDSPKEDIPAPTGISPEDSTNPDTSTTVTQERSSGGGCELFGAITAKASSNLALNFFAMLAFPVPLTRMLARRRRKNVCRRSHPFDP